MIGAPVFFPAGPIAIRDATFDRIATVPGFKNVFKANSSPNQDAQMPYACIWYSGERTEPNGDANAGVPAFKHTLTLTVDVVVRNVSDPAMDAEIVALVETTRATLLTDPDWVAMVEGIERIDTRYTYPSTAQDIVVLAVIELEVTYRSEWPPTLAHDLDVVTVTVEPERGPWDCRYCGSSNEARAPCCSTCSAPAPEPVSFTTEIDLDRPSC